MIAGLPIKAVMRATKALADSQRVRILMLLEGGELCVCQIVEVLGLAPSTVSKHLSILEDADLIAGRKDGRWAYYRQGSFAAPVRKWIGQSLENDPEIEQDRKKLKRVTACDPVVLRERQRKGSRA